MTRLALLAAVVLGVAGCATKPTEDECRTAIENMQRLMGTENLRKDAQIEGDVRRCKGGSKKKAVQCAIKAQTLDDLRHCDFYKVPANAPGIGSGADTAPAAPTGSAAPAAPTGSAAPAAPTGSAAPAAPTGSAATSGSAAPTPPSGSAAPTGSAASPGAAAGSAAKSAGSAAGSAK